MSLKYYILISARSPEAEENVNTDELIVSIGNHEILLESIFTKIHQTAGNMKISMTA